LLDRRRTVTRGKLVEKSKKCLPKRSLECTQIATRLDSRKPSATICFVTRCQIQEVLMDVEGLGFGCCHPQISQPDRSREAESNKIAARKKVHA